MNGRTTAFFALATIATLATVLWLDGPGLPRQLALAAPVWALLGLVFATHPDLTRETLIAVAIATTGEVILSIGLGIYEYKSGGVPLYVPPGHGVIYLLALQASRHLERFRRVIEPTTFVAGSLVAVVAALMFNDTFGLLCWIVMLMIVSTSPRRLLIATCVCVTSVLEIAGTLAGNWTWGEHQGLLRSGNPPVGVVLLYCCLDLLTIMAVSSLARRRRSVRVAQAHLDVALTHPHPQLVTSRYAQQETNF
ncbi:MAG: hypothetical protein WA208_04065 [Thermoanaerobaculia bacterium]